MKTTRKKSPRKRIEEVSLRSRLKGTVKCNLYGRWCLCINTFSNSSAQQHKWIEWATGLGTIYKERERGVGGEPNDHNVVFARQKR